MSIRRCLLGAACALAAASPAAAQWRNTGVSSVSFYVGQWRFVPLVDEGAASVPAFLAYYIGDDAYGNNVTVVLFEADGEGSWQGATWPDADLGLAAVYTVDRYGEIGQSILLDDEIVEAIENGGYDINSEEAPEPEPLGLGMSRENSWYEIAAQAESPGALLDALRKLGHPITPELPAIAARSAAMAADDLDEVDRITAISIGMSTEPTLTCEVAARYVSLAAASLDAEAAGMTALLTELAGRAEEALFGRSVHQTRAILCWPGCTETCRPCAGTGAWTFYGRLPNGMGGLHCTWSRSGTTTCRRAGITFWCCNPCTTTPYTRDCVELTGCTVELPGACPATPAGCP
jgi:hypothetical protein